MMQTKTDSLRVVLTLGLISLIVVVSQALYTLKNNPSYLQYLYIFQFNQSLKQSNIKTALHSLDKMTDNQIYAVFKNQDWYIKQYEQNKQNFPTIVTNDTPFLDYLEEINVSVDELRTSNPPDMSKHLYRLGLIAFKQQDHMLTEALLLRMVYLNSEWSPFHIELATYYLSQGKEDEAREVLAFCKKMKYPVDSCTIFEQEVFVEGKAYEVGSYFAEISSL